MSLILEALKKLDREKQAPDRGVLVVGPSAWPSPREHRSPVALVTFAVGLVALLGVGAAVWFLRGFQQPVPAQTAISSPPAVAAVPPRAPGVPAAGGSSAGVAGERGRPAPRPMTAAEGRIEPATSQSATTDARSAAQSEPAHAESAAVAAGSATTPESGEAAAPGAVEPRAAPTAPGNVTGSARTTAPRPGTQDVQLQAISSQDGHPIAVLNGHLVREGDTVDGMRVVRIGADEVEIEIRGRRRVVKF